MILFWEKERGRREEKKRREDRIKSAMGIKSFCHDIVFFGNGVFGRMGMFLAGFLADA